MKPVRPFSVVFLIQAAICSSLVLLMCGLAGCGTRDFGSGASALGRAAGALIDCTNLPQWTVKTYVGGDRVQNHAVAYECKPFPFSGWCGQIGYEPGVAAAWADAWIRVDDCGGTSTGAGGSTGSGGNTGSGGTNDAGTTSTCDPTSDNCCPETGFTEQVLTNGPDTVSIAQPNVCIRALDGSDTIMAGPSGYVAGGAGDDTINAWSGGTVIPGPGTDTVSVSGGATVKIFDLCEAPSGEHLDGGGNGTLITPVSLADLEARGVVVSKTGVISVPFPP